MRLTSLALSVWLITSTIAPIAATPAVDSESTGVLSIVSDPAGAVAYVDGRVIGQTPIDVPRLAAGDHRVRLIKEGYLENGRIVTVARGTRQTLQVRMTGHSVAASAPAPASAEQVTGGSGGSNKKWLYIGIAGGAAAVAAVALAGGNSAPTVGEVRASPTTGLAASTAIQFTASATDKDNDP